jgi:hypothetical protein
VSRPAYFPPAKTGSDRTELRDEAAVGGDQEAAGRDALGIEIFRVHEVVDDERELADLLPARPERTGVASGERDEPSQDERQEGGPREGPEQHARAGAERVDPRVPDVRRLANDRGEEFRVGVQVEEAVFARRT